MKSLIVFLLSFFVSISSTRGQSLGTPSPVEADTSEKYVFYLHGGIIQSRGINAVSPYWGRYEYTAILDTLKNYGYNVISEVRPKDTDLLKYAEKVSKEITTLLESGVNPENIVVVGASMGAGIALNVSIRLKNSKIKYALMGICRQGSWEAYLQHYSEKERKLCGKFLSIYETSDSYGSCEDYLAKQPCVSEFNEIRLTMNNGHGFLYKPYQEWIHPLVNWINGTGE